MRISRLFLVAATAAGLGLAAPAAASAATHTYLFDVSTISGDAKYVVPVKPNSPGTTFNVATDALGRIIRVETVRAAKTLSVLHYTYPGSSLYANGFASYRSGKLTDHGVIKRDARGYRTRTTWYTVTGSLSSYTVRTIHGNTVDGVSHDKSGAQTSRYRDTFNASGILVAETDWESPTTYSLSTYNPVNGEELTDKIYIKGVFDNSSVMTYDAYGDLLRKESFDPSGKKFFDVTYQDGLPVRRLKLGSDQIVTLLRYNSDRLLTSARMLVNGKLVCKFVYERDVDGRLKRTLAYSPAGELWAEYPNQYVEEVERDGHAILGIPGTLYHTQNWW